MNLFINIFIYNIQHMPRDVDHNNGNLGVLTVYDIFMASVSSIELFHTEG